MSYQLRDVIIKILGHNIEYQQNIQGRQISLRKRRLSMKTCAVCGSNYHTLLAACPQCGTEGIFRTKSDKDAEKVMASLRIQEESAMHVNRGAQLYEREEYDEAEKEYNEAIKINPKNVYAHGNMGLIFLRRDQPEKAIKWFEKALELNPYYEGGIAILEKARALANEKRCNR
jgi:tetratricopeptide (TPR) repeat protein